MEGRREGGKVRGKVRRKEGRREGREEERRKEGGRGGFAVLLRGIHGKRKERSLKRKRVKDLMRLVLSSRPGRVVEVLKERGFKRRERSAQTFCDRPGERRMSIHCST